MQVADKVSTPTSTSKDSAEQWAETIFRKSLGLIRVVLAEQYQLSEEDSVVLEADLFTWFLRFCRRPTSETGTDFTAREALLVMACVLARSLQQSRTTLNLSQADGNLDDVLRRDPVEVAREASRPLRFHYRGLHPA